MKRVVVTGMGVLSALGKDVNSFWNSILNGKSGISTISRFDASSFPTRIGGEIRNWQPSESFTSKEINRRDRLSLYAMESARQAMNQSGLSGSSYDPERCGVVWASGNGGIESIEEGLLAYSRSEENPRFSPFFVPRSLLDTPSGEIAMAHNFKGINFAVVSACASSNSAIMDAFNYIRWDKADVIIAGGSEAPITRSLIGGFGAMKALSRRNDDPEGASRPMDAGRDGFVMSEGSGALVLESLDHALARKATIIAEICGASMTNDAYHPTATHPEGEGAARGMRLALMDAGLAPDNIDYINMHATGTPVGDMSEVAAIRKVFDREKIPYMSATKSMTGHLLGAAGAIEAIISILSISNNVIPPTINLDDPDPEITNELPVIRFKPYQTSVNYALSNTFGFGGHNAIVIFGRF